MITASTSQVIVPEFEFNSTLSSEIGEFIDSLEPEDAPAKLSRLIEIGWLATQFNQARVLSDYVEKVTLKWTSRLASEFQESGSQMFEELRNDVTAGLSDLKEMILVQSAVTRTSADLKGKSTAKGVTFESELMESLSYFASIRGDVITYVGNTPGTDSSKKGDFIYQDAVSGATIAIEAKDYNTKLSPSKIEELIEDSMKNRSSKFGLFVVRNQECLPSCYGSFHLGFNNVICTVENVQLAIKVMSVLEQKASVRGYQQVQIEKFVVDIQQELKTMGDISRSAGVCRKAAAMTESALGELKQSLEARLNQFLSVGK